MPEKQEPQPSDAELLHAALSDPAAFTALYRRHVDRVYRYLLFQTGQVEDAQDLTSQTFVIALERLSSYRGEGSVHAWLLGIARYRLLNHRRSQRHTVALESIDGVLPAPLDLAEAVATSLQRERVVRALRVIAPDRAEAISLRFFGELSTAEVAQTLGKSPAAVRMLIHRGLTDLRRQLAPTAATLEGEP